VAAVVLAAGAAVVALTAGGTGPWARWLLGAVSVVGFAAAARFRTGLHVGVIAGVATVAVVPVDAVIDRGLVAGVGGVLVLLASECTQVARRLITIAPVSSSRRDVRAVVGLALAAAAATAATSLVARIAEPLGRPGIGALLVVGGLAIAASAVRRPAATG
jgi:hypothetical protein